MALSTPGSASVDVFLSIFVMSGCQWFACTQVRCLCVQDVFACFLQ